MQKALFGAYLCVLFWHGMCQSRRVIYKSHIVRLTLLFLLLLPSQYSWSQQNDCVREVFIYIDASASMYEKDDSGITTIYKEIEFIHKLLSDTTKIRDGAIINIGFFGRLKWGEIIEEREFYLTSSIRDSISEKLKEIAADLKKQGNSTPNIGTTFQKVVEKLNLVNKLGDVSTMVLILSDFRVLYKGSSAKPQYDNKVIEGRINTIDSLFENTKEFTNKGVSFLLVDLENNSSNKKRDQGNILDIIYKKDTSLFTKVDLNSIDEVSERIKEKFNRRIDFSERKNFPEISVTEDKQYLRVKGEFENPGCNPTKDIRYTIAPISINDVQLTKEREVFVGTLKDKAPLEIDTLLEWKAGYDKLIRNLNNTELSAVLTVEVGEKKFNDTIRSTRLNPSDFESIEVELKEVVKVSQTFLISDQAKFEVLIKVLCKGTLKAEKVRIGNVEYPVIKTLSDEKVAKSHSGKVVEDLSIIIGIDRGQYDSLNISDSNISILFSDGTWVDALSNESRKDNEIGWVKYFFCIVNSVMLLIITSLNLLLKLPFFKRFSFVIRLIENFGSAHNLWLTETFFGVSSGTTIYNFTIVSDVWYIEVVNSVCLVLIVSLLCSFRLFRLLVFRKYNFKELPSYQESTGYFRKVKNFRIGYFLCICLMFIGYLALHLTGIL